MVMSVCTVVCSSFCLRVKYSCSGSSARSAPVSLCTRGVDGTSYLPHIIFCLLRDGSSVMVVVGVVVFVVGAVRMHRSFPLCCGRDNWMP